MSLACLTPGPVPGAKKGIQSESNPIRLNWPDVITSPIDGQQSPDLLDWDSERHMCRVWKYRLASMPSDFCKTQHAPRSSTSQPDVKQTWCSPAMEQPGPTEHRLPRIGNMPVRDLDAFNDVLAAFQAAYDEVVQLDIGAL